MTGYCGVLPLNLHGLAWLDVDGLILLIQDVALRCLQFAQVHPAAQTVRDLDVDVTFIVAGVLAQRVLVGVVQQELRAIDALLRAAVDFVDDDS